MEEEEKVEREAHFVLIISPERFFFLARVLLSPFPFVPTASSRVEPFVAPHFRFHF